MGNAVAAGTVVVAANADVGQEHQRVFQALGLVQGDDLHAACVRFQPQQLRLVADFFRRTEPHSPVAFLADKAARWGDMPLDAWLREVIKDAGSLAHLEELLGLPNAAE